MTHSEGYFNPGHEPDDPQIGEPHLGEEIHHEDMPRGPWEAGQKSWEAAMTEHDRWLREHVDVEHGIDEVALLFYDPEHIFNFITQAVAQNEVYLSGADRDVVHVDPMRSHYHVTYWWLEHHDKTYRLELMLKESGFSPIHDKLKVDAMQEAHDEHAEEGGPHILKAPVVVHFSFRARDSAHYTRLNQELNECDDAEYVQFCRSSYGMFSYWRVPSLWDKGAATYLKPRVNMRDGGEQWGGAK